MAGQEYQYIGEILKEFYTPAIINQLWKKSPLWAIIKKKTQDMVGKRVVIPVRIGLTEAVGSRAANDYTLPTAQRNLYDQAYISMKRVYGRVMVDGLSIESAKGKGGWVDVLQAEIQGVTDAFTLDIDRQLMTTGKSILGFCSAAVAGQTVTVDTPGGIVDTAGYTKFFRKGQVVDIYDSDYSPIHATAVQISGIAPSTSTLTFTGNVASVEDDDVILKANSYGANDATGDLMGIDGIVSAGNTPGSDFEGIDATSEASWQAMVDTTGGVLTEELIQKDLDAIEDNTDGEPVDLILTSQTLRNKLIAIMKSTYYKTESIDLVAGWKALSYVGGAAELPVMTHKNCPVKYMYYLSRPHLTLWVLKNLVWDDKGGGVVKPVAGSDQYEAWFKIYANLGTDCRNAHGKCTNFTTA
jgi:hypothetical protein